MVSELPQDPLSHVSHEGVPGTPGESDLPVALPDPDGRRTIFVLQNLDLRTGPAFRAKGHFLCDLHGHHLLSLNNLDLPVPWKAKRYFAVTEDAFRSRAVLHVPVPEPPFPQLLQG